MYYLTHLILPATSWGGSHCYPHFTDKGPEAQRVQWLSQGSILRWQLCGTQVLSCTIVLSITQKKICTWVFITALFIIVPDLHTAKGNLARSTEITGVLSLDPAIPL